MKVDTRRRILFIVLAMLLLSMATVRYLRQVPETRSDRPAPAAVEKAAPKSRSAVATLRTADLAQLPSGSAIGRDPWRFIDPPPQQRRREPASTTTAQHPTPQPSPSPSVQLPELGMEYLGHFGPPEKKIAVFSNGKRVHNALEGDVIDGQFIVARIGPESVDLRYVDFPGLPAKRLGVRRR